MTTIYHAHTVPVNPPGATPVLSEAQVFAGFQRKMRHPAEFVPAILAAEVLSDQDGVVTRRVTFRPPPGSTDPPHVATEVCTEHPPHRVDYAIDDGSTVLNLISTGSRGGGGGGGGDVADLYVTYSFGWKYPELVPGSAAAQAAEARHKEAVESSIATTRKLVSDGMIP